MLLYQCILFPMVLCEASWTRAGDDEAIWGRVCVRVWVCVWKVKRSVSRRAERMLGKEWDHFPKEYGALSEFDRVGRDWLTLVIFGKISYFFGGGNTSTGYALTTPSMESFFFGDSVPVFCCLVWFSPPLFRGFFGSFCVVCFSLLFGSVCVCVCGYP